VTYAKKIDKAETRLDFTQQRRRSSAGPRLRPRARRVVRAGGERFKVLAAEVVGHGGLPAPCWTMH
jgi:hypothetical protein